MKTMTNSQVAYIAGVIDGEGCLSVRRIGANRFKQSTFWLQLKVSNTNKEILDYLLETTGLGRLSNAMINKTVTGNSKPYWKWMVKQSEALELLVLLRPWLIVKRRVTSLVFALRELQSSDWRNVDPKISEAREVIYAQIKEANFRGVKRKEGELLGSPERTISSQAEEGILLKVQRLEAESRTDSNASKSAFPERDEIV